MKRFFFILVVIVCSVIQVKGKCTGGGIEVWPKSSTLTPNSLLMLYGFDEEEDFIRQVARGNKTLFVTSGKEKIELKVLKFLKGDFGVSQVLLQPVQKLTAGKQYSFKATAPAYTEVEKSWTVIEMPDTLKPEWKSIPVFQKSYHIVYGCGPASGVIFEAAATELVLVNAKITSSEISYVGEFFIELHKDEINLGHGMCGGEFRLQNGVEYQAELTLMDASGNFGELKTVIFKKTNG